jgi:hypothetical protein
MKWLSAGLTFVNISTICGILLGMARHGLSKRVAMASALIGLGAALLAYLGTRHRRPQEELMGAAVPSPDAAGIAGALQRYRMFWLWLVVAVFAIFAFRSFCNVLFIDNNEFKIQSPNNLGDLSLHLTYINNFASGVHLWPDNPIYAFSRLRYPAGIDFFNAILVSLDIDIIRGLVWTGLLASAATCYALYRWGGTFGIAGFLFNGGLAGFQFFKTFTWQDYQGGNFIAWKSLVLAMMVTQRGLLYALPVGLLLLYQWRAKFFPPNQAALSEAPASSQSGGLETPAGFASSLAAPAAPPRPPLPFWVELSLYATMPLFHVHTFLALSFVLAFLFLFLLPNSRARKQLAFLAGAALLPATFFVWLVTDRFHAGTVMQWNPGWVQNNGDFARPLAAFSNPPGAVATPVSGFFGTINHFFQFWIINFGITIPLIIALVALLGIRTWKQRNEPAPAKIYLVAFLAALAVLLVVFACLFSYLSLGYSLFVVLAIIPPVALAALILPSTALLGRDWKQTIPINASTAFVIPAVALFLISCFVKTAPWEWDNIKLIIWAYLLVLPFLWSEVISRWAFPIRALVCVVMFGSGFVTLFGGLAAGKTGFGLANRAEVDAVGKAVRKLPAEARYAAFPIYNHPLLLQGRKVVLGYPGHVWTQGFNYGDDAAKLTTLMQGAPDWKQTARYFNARYLFWGREEKTNYAQSKRPWEQESKLVATGDWGSIYDLESPREPAAIPPGQVAGNPAAAAASPAPTGAP